MFRKKIANPVISYLKKKNPNPLISHVTLRRLIGIVGISLPLVCWLGGWLWASLPLQQSISFYYHTNVRDFFVGLLVVVSLFLITYKGYENRDNILTTITGFFGLMVVIFPCLFVKGGNPIGFFQRHQECSNTIHQICSVFFFGLLAANSYLLFTKTDKKKEMWVNKGKRNRVYKACGILMGITLAALIIIVKVNEHFAEEMRIIFWLETIMVVSFAVSWIVKSGWGWADPKPKKIKQKKS